MKTLLLGGIAATVIATVAVAQAPAPSQTQRTAKVQTRAEVGAKVQQRFTRIDANRDGAITQAEVEALKTSKRGRTGKAGGRRGDPGQWFARLDANQDGQITRAEFQAMRSARVEQTPSPQWAQRAEQMFARLDADRNGAISRAELDAGRQARQQRPAQGGEAMQNRAKRGGGMGGRMGGHMFTMADANKDGRVTLQEAQATALRHFDMADANKDGQVTREERRQIRQQMRQHQG